MSRSKRKRRRRNPHENELDNARALAMSVESWFVVEVIDVYLERYSDEDAGEYFAAASEVAWELDDVLFDNEIDAHNAHEILHCAAVNMGGDPIYGRDCNPKALRQEHAAREAVRQHASDRRWKQRIPGGTKRAPASFDRRALLRGTTVELEHTTDPLVALEIAMDHLDEDPHYYCTSCRTPRGNPDPAACALGKWAWDRDPAPCGKDSPSPSQAGRDLARKRWTLPERERRVAARILV